jgi:RND family efflux transporter MFP subunit
MSTWLRGQMLGWSAGGLALVAAGAFSMGLLARGAGKGEGAGNGGPDGSPGQALQTLRVKAVRPARERLRRSTTQPAHVEAYAKVDIHAKVSGYLKKFGQVREAGGNLRDLDLGDRVGKDQVLAELWVPEVEQERAQKEVLVEQAETEQKQAEAALEAGKALVVAAQARVEQTRADLGRLEAERDFRRSEYERYRQLLAERTVERALVEERYNRYRGALSAYAGGKAAVSTAQANLRVEKARQVKAEADVRSAKARVKVAKSNLKQAEIIAGYAQIRAPFAGILTRRTVDTGAFVQSAAATTRPMPLFTLARIDRLRIVADIPETDAPWVRIGQSASLRVDAARGQLFTGKVARLADALDSGTRTMRVEVKLDKLAEVLRPGLFGAVNIVLADYADNLMLPTSTLVPTLDKPAVMVVREGKARRQVITLGINDGVRMQVTGGLKGDDLVITDGKDAVREGQPVEVVP